MRHLACDGPLNGLYIDGAQAMANGYWLDEWPNGEEVFIHGGLLETAVGVAEIILETVSDPDLRHRNRI